ncbi:MAG: hypothetical protein R3E94_12825 [Burkholderiaceae bacterium]
MWFATADAPPITCQHCVPLATHGRRHVPPGRRHRSGLQPAQMILLINGLQGRLPELEWGAVGVPAPTHGSALAREPACRSCFPGGGVADDELLLALKPRSWPIRLSLSANGLRYPIPPYGVQCAGRHCSYGQKLERGCDR